MFNDFLKILGPEIISTLSECDIENMRDAFNIVVDSATQRAYNSGFSDCDSRYRFPDTTGQ